MEKHSSSQTNLTLARTYHRHGNRTKCFNVYTHTRMYIFKQYRAEKFLVCMTRGDEEKQEGGTGMHGRHRERTGLAEAFGKQAEGSRLPAGCAPIRARQFRGGSGSGPGDGMEDPPG